MFVIRVVSSACVVLMLPNLGYRADIVSGKGKHRFLAVENVVENGSEKIPDVKGMNGRAVPKWSSVPKSGVGSCGDKGPHMWGSGAVLISCTATLVPD